MAPRCLSITVLLTLLAVAIVAPGRAQDTVSAEVIKTAREDLGKSFDKLAAALHKSVKQEPVAWMEVRADREGDLEQETLAIAQSVALQHLLLAGVLVYRVEADAPFEIARTNGNLPSARTMAKDLTAGLAEKGVRLLAIPRCLLRPNGIALQIDVYDLARGRSEFSGKCSSAVLLHPDLNEICRPRWLPERNTEILLFAAANFGKQVDRGECWDLPAVILRRLDARVQGYDFGEEIKWEQALPGDVLTFGESGATGGHVAVLFQRESGALPSPILEQNVGGRRYVQFGTVSEAARSDENRRFRVWRP